MIARHSLTLTCRCPENGRLDSYEITVETNKTMLVEFIEEAAAEFLGKSIHQETLALVLAEIFECSVTVTGHHGAVRSVVKAP